MFLKTVTAIVLIHVLTAVSAAPRRTRPTVMWWHQPCGEVLESDLTPIDNLKEEIKDTLDILKLQHKLIMSDYYNHGYENLYQKVRIGVHQHQYIPNWLPGNRDVVQIQKLVNASSQTIVNHLPKLHLDLQKFAVAFEQLIDNERNQTIKVALSVTQTYMMMMLCEVESKVEVLLPLWVLERIQRSIMNKRERKLVHDTTRLIRDWGVMIKYKNYIEAWNQVFNSYVS